MSNNASGSGLGFTSLLTITFITLKLTSVIDWSWWWVLSPLWIPIVIIFVISLVYTFVKALNRSSGKR